ncbi:MAG: ATP-binding protein [Longimicrobiales bacterium]|nr:ATP-binding protein [Longimicrobiales bacterium]
MREPLAEYVKEHYGADPVLIACGLPASNKTETMEVVSRIKGYTILRTDMIRKLVLKGEDIFDEKVASNMDKRGLVYDEMFRRAGEIVASGVGVILDATFVTQTLRMRAAQVAAENGKLLMIQQTYCTQEYSLNKISKRTKENYESNALTDQAYFNNKSKFEPVDLDDFKSRFPSLGIVHLIVDTNSDLEADWHVIERFDRS